MSNEKVELKEHEIVTVPCRLAFPALFKPKPRMKGKADSRETYQAVVLIPPDTDLKPFYRAMKAAMEDKWGKVIQLNASKNPLRDASEKTEIDGYEEGWHYINTHSGFAPGLVDQRRQPIIDPEKLYAGCWCHFCLSAYAWEHPQGGRGVSFSLTAVQLVRDDDRLDGRKQAAQIFDAIEMDDEDMGGDDEMFGGESEKKSSDVLDELFS